MGRYSPQATQTAALHTKNVLGGSCIPGIAKGRGKGGGGRACMQKLTDVDTSES